MDGLDLDDSRPLTPAERAFLTRLFAGRSSDLDVWLRQDDDGTPWLMVSHDLVVGKSIRDTLRLDFDGREIAGGWSPACLNWDDGVRAHAAEIPTDPPEGIRLRGSPAEFANAARTWFDAHIAAWPSSARRARLDSQLGRRP